MFADELEQRSRGDKPEPELNQFVRVRLAGQSYALPLTQVEQIIRLGRVTRIPHTAPYVYGIISRQGITVPLIDLRRRLELPAGEMAEETRVVIAQTKPAPPKGESTLIGLIVDAVDGIISEADATASNAADMSALPIAERFCTRLITVTDHSIAIVLALQEIIG